MEYLDFELRISSGSGRAYPVTVVRSPAGETSGTMQFPFDKLALDNQLLGLQNALLRSGVLRRQAVADPEETRGVVDFGKQLFQALFTPELQVAYRRSRDRAAAEDKGLRLRLRIEAPELASLPWEFMYDPTERDYVCLSTDTPLVRYLEFDQPPPPLTIRPPLSLLVMIASPSDRPALDVARERERIEHATRRLRSEGFMRIEWMQGSSWRDLQQALRRNKHHIFHFVGHGGFDSAAGEGALMLTDEDGRASMISATAIARLLSDHRTLRLAVLNSCLGAKASATDVLSSTAAVLVGRGLPAVVAMQFEISDEAAIEFSRSLYDAIAEGMPIDAAVAEARKAMITRATHSVEWGTPVLHMRSPDGVLFRLDGTKPSEARITGNFPKPTWTPTERIDAAPPAVAGARADTGGTGPMAAGRVAAGDTPPPGAASARPPAAAAPATEAASSPTGAPFRDEATPPRAASAAMQSRASGSNAPSTPVATTDAMNTARDAAAHDGRSPGERTPRDGGGGAGGQRAAAPSSSRGMLWGVVGAVAVAAGVAAYLMRPGPAPETPATPRLAAIADVRLLDADTITLVRGGDFHARYRLFGPGSDDPVANGDSLLRAAGDRVVLLTSAAGVVRADTGHVADGAIALEGLVAGVAEVWPVLLRANGDSAGSKRRTVVLVTESTETVKRANESFLAVRDAMRDSSVSDSALLGRIVQLDSSYGGILRDDLGRTDDLAAMLAGARALLAARQQADSVAADSNATLPARYAALQRYLSLVGEHRGGRAPTSAADSARLAAFDARPVGTVLKAGVCIGYPCNDSASLIDKARVGDKVGVKAWYVTGSSRNAQLEWRRDGIVQGARTPLTIEQYVAVGWRAQGVRDVREPGRWEVRVLNGRNQLVFRHAFDVQ